MADQMTQLSDLISEDLSLAKVDLHTNFSMDSHRYAIANPGGSLDNANFTNLQ